MRRARLIIVAGLAALAWLLVSRGSASPEYRFAAVFDTAKGIVPGQAMKLAGVQVGTVLAVHLTPDMNAALELEVPRRFGPFHADSTCQILPQGLISEYYVQCDPGTPGQPRLAVGPGGLPTVPLDRTTEPVGVQEMIDIFSAPVSARLRVLVNELGIATAGRGTDINNILLRADPALVQARNLLTEVDRQRAQVDMAVGQTDRVTAELAAQRGGVRRFVGQAASFYRETSEHQAGVRSWIDQLPRLLGAIRTTFPALDSLTRTAVPVLGDLHAASPSFTALTGQIPPFAAAATPGIRSLGTAAATGTTALHAAARVVAHLRTFAHAADPTGTQLELLLKSMRDSGALEGLLDLGYVMAGTEGYYDSLSHLLGVILVPSHCYSDPTAAGCNHNYNASTRISGTPAATPRHRIHHRAKPAPAAPPTISSASPPTRNGPTVPGTPAGTLPHLPSLPSLPSVGVHAQIAGVSALLRYLLSP